MFSKILKEHQAKQSVLREENGIPFYFIIFYFIFNDYFIIR